MKKVKLNDLPRSAKTSRSDNMILSGFNVPVDKALKDIGITNGFYYEKTLQNGEEVDIEHSGIGIYLINSIGNGISAIFIIGAFPEQSVKITESRQAEEFFVYGEKTGKYCIYRKTISGNIFLKNNTGSIRGVRIHAITTPIA